jgi:hypothetical protein
VPHRPSIPADTTLPRTAGRWEYDEESSYNAHVWTDPDNTSAVGVFTIHDSSYAQVIDERVNGFGNTTEIAHRSFTIPSGIPSTDISRMEATATVIDTAVSWMQNHSPPWNHPAVESAAFTPPPAHKFYTYRLESQTHEIIYQYPLMSSKTHPHPVSNHCTDSVYLCVDVSRASGKAAITAAPHPRASPAHKQEIKTLPPQTGVIEALEETAKWAAKNC